MALLKWYFRNYGHKNLLFWLVKLYFFEKVTTLSVDGTLFFL